MKIDFKVVAAAFTTLSVSIAAAAEPAAVSQLQTAPAAPVEKTLDSIPSALFDKMFQSHKLVALPD